MTTETLSVESLAIEVADINRRVGVLYDVARAALPTHLLSRLEGAAPVAETAPAPAPESYDDSDRDVHGRSPLDYGAIAFGLSEIKRKIAAQFGASDELNREHAGSVQWFADVFALADPTFDMAAFTRNAGV
jgi:hypothetical protein